MANLNSGSAIQGSRLYLQEYMVNAKEELSELIIAASPSLLSFIGSKSEIEWKSPLKKPEKPGKEEFYEYRDDFLEVLELKEYIISDAKEKLREFWPKNGPQWDGLAVVYLNGKCGCINSQGDIVIEQRFDSAFGFKDGLMCVGTNYLEN
ncbi:WG repeat-containing protein [Clostridium sp.]